MCIRDRNRPDQLNTIVPPMPDEIEGAVGLAERDQNIKVIVLRGAGRAFCAGYDFGGGFQHWGEGMMTDGQWDPGKDFAMVTARETGPTQKFSVDRTKTRHSDGAELGCRTPCLLYTSNGGLLMGIMLTKYPEKFGALVCSVPLLDMKRYHLLLAGASWVAEYGDPDNPNDWEFISEYSPYQNISATRTYPPVLFTTSTRDDRVHPGHARKMVAALEAAGHRIWYYENIEGGHAGACLLYTSRGLLGGLEHHRVAGRQRRSQFPGSHQDREVPRNDLSHHPERLMEVVGNGVVVDLRQRTLLGADRRGEIPEMISCQRNVGGQRLPNRLAVVPDFGERERVFVRVNAIGDLVQDRRPLGRGGFAPPGGGRVRGVECLFDVGLIRARHLAERLAGDRRRVLEIQTLGWGDPLAPDEVVVPGLIRHCLLYTSRCV